MSTSTHPDNSQLSADLVARARARLQAAGLPEERIAVVIDRAAQLLAGLGALAELDPRLPEPALTWQPIEESAS